MTHNTRMHYHKRDLLVVVALFAPPLEAWIRRVAPFYAQTIAFRKPNCARDSHISLQTADSVVDQAPGYLLGCVLLVVVVVVRAKRQTNQKTQKTRIQKVPFDVSMRLEKPADTRTDSRPVR